MNTKWLGLLGLFFIGLWLWLIQPDEPTQKELISLQDSFAQVEEPYIPPKEERRPPSTRSEAFVQQGGDDADNPSSKPDAAQSDSESAPETKHQLDLIWEEYSNIQSGVITKLESLHASPDSYSGQLSLSALGIDMDLYGGYDVENSAQVLTINGHRVDNIIYQLPPGSLLAGPKLELTILNQGKQEQISFTPY